MIYLTCMRPETIKTRIFLDGGDQEETIKIKGLMGFLDGQTTNPTLIRKNPSINKRLKNGIKFSEEELLGEYKKLVVEISQILHQNSSVSIEVYSDRETRAQTMLEQARLMNSWIPNAHIKFPITQAGLEAAKKAVCEGININMTLVFSQEQAEAVWNAAKGVKKGAVFISPFVGRLDDKGEDGISLVENILRMYSKNSPVEVLTASVRNINHLLAAIRLGSDIVTAPFNVLKEWAEQGMPIPDEGFLYSPPGLTKIPFKELNIDRPWRKVDITHELTFSGLDRFADDWKDLLI